MDLYKVYINHDFEVTVTCFKAISTYCRLSRHFIGGGSCGGVCVGGGYEMPFHWQKWTNGKKIVCKFSVQC